MFQFMRRLWQKQAPEQRSGEKSKGEHKGKRGETRPNNPPLPRLLAAQSAHEGKIRLAPLFDHESPEQLEEMCRQLPIEELVLYPWMTDGMDWAIQVVFTVAKYTAAKRELGKYADLVIPRFITRLKAHDSTDIVPIACSHIRDLALCLIKGGRHREARECLLYAQNMIFGKTPDLAYWLFAATVNIAMQSEKREEIQAALDLVDTLKPEEREQLKVMIDACRQSMLLGGKPNDHCRSTKTDHQEGS